MTSTGQRYPTLGTSVSESPWSDNTWTTPTNIYSDNAATANITASTYDSGDQSFVLKATGFDFSDIPDTATIDGVTVRVNAWYRSGTGTGSMDLLQLLNTSRAKVGTNQCSTPVALTTTNSTVITKGSSSDLWGNSLTPAWVKDADFGVAIGMLSTAANTDLDVDYVTIEIEYTVIPDVTVDGVTFSATVSTSFGSVDVYVTQDGVQYLLRDKFTTDLNPLVDASASEIGYRDVTGTAFYAEDGRLRGGNTAEGKIVYQPYSGGSGFSRVGGRTFAALLTPDDGEGDVSLWLAETAGTLNGYGLRLTNTTFEIIEPDGNTITAVLNDGKPAKGVAYLAGITLNEDFGAVYWVSANATYTADSDWPIYGYPDARILYVSTLGTFATAHPTVRASTGFSYPGGVSIEDVRLLDISTWSGEDGMAVAADRFNRADVTSPISASWTAQASSAWGISSNEAYGSTGTFNGRAYMEAGIADVFVVATVTSGSDLGDWFGLNIRDNGSNSFIRFYNNGTANIYAQSFVSNSYQDQLTATYAAFATSQTKRWLVGAYGNSYRVWIDGDAYTIQPFTYGYTDHETNTKFGLFGDSASGQRWDNFAVYPIQLALPDEFDTGAYPQTYTAEATEFTDAFTDSDSTALATHDADWTVVNGTWTIQSNALAVTGSGQLSAYVTASQADYEVQTDVIMVSSVDTVRAGLTLRRADANNFVTVRCFVDPSQLNNDEIEVQETIAGSTNVVHKCYLLNYFQNSTTYTLKAQVVGGVLHIFLDGVLQLTVYLSNSALLSGTGVGLYEEAGGDAVTFDNFSVAPIGVSSTPVTVTGETFSASIGTSFGSVTAVRNVTVSAASLSASVGTSFGSVTTVRNVTVSAASLSASISTSFGTATGEQNVTVTGASLSASVGTSFGSVTGTAIVTAETFSASVGTSFGSVAGGAVASAESFTATVGTSFGSVSTSGAVTVSGASLSVTIGTSFGSVTAVRNVTVTGASPGASVSTSFGSVTAIQNVTISGASLSATVSGSYGSVSAGGTVSVDGETFTVSIGASFGSVVAVQNTTASGAALAASAAISAGSVVGDASIAGETYSASASGLYGAVSGKAVVSGATLPASVGTSFGSVTGTAVVSGESLSASVSSSFGSVEAGGAIAVAGVSLSATVSTSFGSVVAVKNVAVTGASLSASVGTSFGTVAIGARATGASLSASTSISTGSVVATAVIPGAALSASVGTAFGSASGAAVSDGASLSAAVSAAYGSVDVVAYVTLGGVDFTADVTLTPGTVTGTGQKVADVTTSGRTSGTVRVSAYGGAAVSAVAGSTVSVEIRTNEDD